MLGGEAHQIGDGFLHCLQANLSGGWPVGSRLQSGPHPIVREAAVQAQSAAGQPHLLPSMQTSRESTGGGPPPPVYAERYPKAIEQGEMVTLPLTEPAVTAAAGSVTPSVHGVPPIADCLVPVHWIELPQQLAQRRHQLKMLRLRHPVSWPAKSCWAPM